MKKFISNIMILVALTAVSCAEKIDKTVTWPEWASRPILSELTVEGEGGAKAIIAGEKVKFTATVVDEYNELKSYTVGVKYSENEVVSITNDISGNQATIEIEFDMPFAAYLAEGEFYPEVTLTATNVANGSASKRVAYENNVAVTRPESPAKLYIIDNAGKTIELAKGEGNKYASVEGADLSGLGSSFYIAEGLNGTTPDYSKLVWGYKDGSIKVVTEGGDPIKTPDSAGRGFRYIGFDLYTFKLDKLVDLTITLDRSTLAEQDQSGVKYLALENVNLVRDCEFVFEGFGDLKSMLQPGMFEIMSDKTARFLGHSTKWSIYYDTVDNWLIVNYADFHAPDQIWVTGEKACFPLGNDATENEFKYLAGDGKIRFASLSAIIDENGDYRLVVYLKDDFALQLFRRVKWAAEMYAESLTEDYCVVTDDKKFIKPGTEFVPGVYELVFTVTEMDDNQGVGAVVDVSMFPYTL